MPGFPELGEFPTATEAVFSGITIRASAASGSTAPSSGPFFLARRIAHGPGDVWALAIELVLPMRERWIGRLTLSLTQRFCLESVIRAHVPET